jgi:protein O-mannosyl-transferase
MDRNPNKNRPLLICLLLALVILAVYYQVHNFSFINYDDPIYVSENSNLHPGLTLNSIKWAFTSGYAGNWHPLTWLSHMLDWQFFGSNPAGHHLTNLLFHIANTLLLFLVLKKMTSAIWQSAFVAALFALHPLHVESVAWISERKDVLSTFFWLLTMWAYIRYVKNLKLKWYLISLVLFALGLMSKPMLVTLPFVLLLLDYWPLERFGQQSFYRLIVEKIPFFVLAASSGVVTFFVQQGSQAVISLTKFPVEYRILNAVISYVKYIEKTCWPVRLAFFYPNPGRNVSIPYAAISAGFLLAVTIFILLFSKKHRYLFTGWFWYIVTLLPVIGLVQVGSQAMADRYSYITLTGLFIIIAWALPELLAKFPHRKAVLWASSLIVLFILAVCAYFQTQNWKDTITLSQHALKVTENNYIAHFCITAPLIEQGRIDQAIWHDTEALRIKPDYVDAMDGLGIAFYKMGKIDDAISQYKNALQLDPCDIKVCYNFGMALAAKGKFDDAVSLYNKALRIAPDAVNIRLNLGVALTSSGKLDQAAKEYEKILLIQPQNATAHNDFGVVLFQQGKIDDAIAHFNQAVKINPNYTDAKNNLTRVLAEKQKSQYKDSQSTGK